MKYATITVISIVIHMTLKSITTIVETILVLILIKRIIEEITPAIGKMCKTINITVTIPPPLNSSMEAKLYIIIIVPIVVIKNVNTGNKRLK
ncbi:hypothetical protein AN1V17_43490 [Vallitalea sediminicola]